MADVKMQVFLYADDAAPALQSSLTLAFADEELVRQFAVDAAIGMRDAVAEYLGVKRYALDYDVEVDWYK